MRLDFLPVMKRELRGYFFSPAAYAVIAIFLVLTGYFFYAGMIIFSQVSYEVARANMRFQLEGLNLAESVIRPMFSNMSVVMLMMMPLITMRLFSEEKKSGTIELLFTYPIRDGSLVLGKFLAASAVFAMMLMPTLTYAAMAAYFQPIPVGNILAGYLGLFLLGCSFLSAGLFISSLTENQIISAGITFGLFLFFWMLGWSFGGDDPSAISSFTRNLSILTHFGDFAKGVVDTAHVVYYLSVITFFLFLTVRSMESHRWRG